MDGEHVLVHGFGTTGPSTDLNNVVHVRHMIIEQFGDSDSLSIRVLSHNFLFNGGVAVNGQVDKSLVSSVRSRALGRGLSAAARLKRCESLSQLLFLLRCEVVVSEQLSKAVFVVSVGVFLEFGNPKLVAFLEHLSEGGLHDGELGR
jgi:hypothetical protein